MSKDVRILNPASDRPFTSRNRARRFVKSGRAVWADAGESSIRFLSADHRHHAAKRSVDATAREYDSAAHDGLARLAALVHVPVIAPAMLLGLGRRKGATRHTFVATISLRE
jgi:hypothetical protein